MCGAYNQALWPLQITAEVIETNEFLELSQRFSVMGVPKTIINGVQELVAQPEARVPAAIRAALANQKGTDA